jgi:hypothetical protein
MKEQLMINSAYTYLIIITIVSWIMTIWSLFDTDEVYYGALEKLLLSVITAIASFVLILTALSDMKLYKYIVI